LIKKYVCVKDNNNFYIFTFFTFFKILQKRDFLRFCRVLYLLSNYGVDLVRVINFSIVL